MTKITNTLKASNWQLKATPRLQEITSLILYTHTHYLMVQLFPSSNINPSQGLYKKPESQIYPSLVWYWSLFSEIGRVEGKTNVDSVAMFLCSTLDCCQSQSDTQTS